MEKDWIQTYSTDNLIKAKMMEDLLKAQGMTPVLINKSGTPYTILQQIEIYVHYTEAEKAIEIIDNIEHE